MEASDCYNLSLNTLITSPFAVDWSQDNQISVITSKGVHILELQPNPLSAYPTAKLKRSFIYPPRNSPIEPYLSQLNSIILEFSRNDLYSFLLDVTLTPRISHKLDHDPRIIDVSWSPKKLLSPTKCLLAIVSSTGSIDIVLKIRNDWHSVINLSTLWFEEIRDELDYGPEITEVDVEEADKFKSTLQRLCGTAITWSPLFQEESIFYSYLLTGYRSSDLVIWKVVRINDLQVKVLPTVAYRTNFNINVRITKLIWINLDINKYLIVIGFFDGRVYGVQINQISDSIIQQSLYQYEPTPDRMAVTCLQEFSRNKKEVNIAIVKSYYLIVITVDKKGKFLRQQHVGFAGFLISGVTPLNNNQLIISTQDTKMYSVSLIKSDLVTKSINYERKTTKVHFLGLTRAPSGATFVNVTSPNFLHDHLEDIQPSTVYFFIFKGDEWNHWKILNRNDVTLGDHWDCLESIRIRAARNPTPEQALPLIPEDVESLSINKLRIVMWLTLITEVMRNKKLVKKIDNFNGEISEAQPLIFVHSAAEFMIKIAKKSSLSNELRLSIHFLRLYMEVFLAGEDESTDKNAAVKLATDALSATAELDLIEEEYCNLCGEMVTDLPWNKPSCPKGHHLPRCAITLLQITCLKYRNCPNCGRIFHPLLDDEFEDVKCLYCDLSAIYDNRIDVVSNEVEKTYNNLSLRPLEASKMEGDNSRNKKRSKKSKTNNNDTFTLIVNKTDETITETWQEF